MASVKITSKGQITIPKEIREKYHLLEGETAVLIPAKEGIMIKHHSGMKKLRGLIKEIDIDKASQFIRELRKEWSL